LLTGAMAITGDCAATTEAAVEQTGQMWEGDGAVVKSVQKWNCAARKITPRSTDAPRLRLHVLTKTELRPEWLQGQVRHAECSPRKKIPDWPLFLGKISFGFGEFGAVRARTANFGQLGIERLCPAGIAGGLSGASGA
jgi:hypothetical protein